MKSLLLFVLLMCASPILAQPSLTARLELKLDPTVAVEATKVDLDILIDQLKIKLEKDQQEAAKRRVFERLIELVESNPDLKARIRLESNDWRQK